MQGLQDGVSGADRHRPSEDLVDGRGTPLARCDASAAHDREPPCALARGRVRAICSERCDAVAAIQERVGDRPGPRATAVRVYAAYASSSDAHLRTDALRRLLHDV